MLTLTLIALLGCNTNGSPNNGATITLGDDTATTGDTDGNVGSLTEDNDQDGYTEEQGDCDDSLASVFPGAYDAPDEYSIDQNCDGTDGVWGTDYTDDDGDCFCDGLSQCLASTNSACETLDVGDCDDTSKTTAPDEHDQCYTETDESCGNETLDEPFDCDGDGQTSAGYGGVDCDDGNPNINTLTGEINSNGYDDNCNDIIDGLRAEISWTDAECTETDCPDASATALTFQFFDDEHTSVLYAYSRGLDAAQGWVVRAGESTDERADEVVFPANVRSTLTYIYVSELPIENTGKTCVIWGPNPTEMLALLNGPDYRSGFDCATLTFPVTE